MVAFSWVEGLRDFSYSHTRWAVAADGLFFLNVTVPAYTDRRLREQVQDERAVTAEPNADGYAYLGGSMSASNADFFLRNFVAAASALMASVELADGKRTGLQPGGWIGYRL